MYHGIYRLKPYKDQQLSVLANWLYSKHINANTITFSGLVFGLLAAVCLCTGRICWGLVFILFSIFADILDGTVARVSQKVSLQGKLFDSICDRVVEVAWVGALIYIDFIPWWGWVLPLSSAVLLFNRFWAYHYHIDTSFIMIARFERVAAILGIIIVPWPWITHSFFLLVSLGTFIASLSIVKTLFIQRNDKFSVDSGIYRG
jgi:phosphatidylglycerophosphate synthase